MDKFRIYIYIFKKKKKKKKKKRGLQDVSGALATSCKLERRRALVVTTLDTISIVFWRRPRESTYSPPMANTPTRANFCVRGS